MHRFSSQYLGNIFTSKKEKTQIIIAKKQASDPLERPMIIKIIFLAKRNLTSDPNWLYKINRPSAYSPT